MRSSRRRGTAERHDRGPEGGGRGGRGGGGERKGGREREREGGREDEGMVVQNNRRGEWR